MVPAGSAPGGRLRAERVRKEPHTITSMVGPELFYFLSGAEAWAQRGGYSHHPLDMVVNWAAVCVAGGRAHGWEPPGYFSLSRLLTDSPSLDGDIDIQKLIYNVFEAAFP